MAYRGQRGGAPSRGGGYRGGGRGRGGFQQYSGAVHASSDGKFPPPNPNVRALEDQTMALSRNNPTTGLNSSSFEGMPVRPAYGSQGREIVVWANSFEIVLREIRSLDWFSINVLPADTASGGKGKDPPKGEKLERIVQLLLKQLPSPNSIATDGRAILLSANPLGFSEKEYIVHYYNETEAQPDAHSPKFRVKLHFTRRLDFEEISRYLRSSNNAEPAPVSKDEMVQAGNIIIAHGLKQNPHVVTKNSKHYPENANSVVNKHILRRDLADGLEALRGFYMSLRPATGRLLLNVQVQNGAFWKAQPLPMVLQLFGGNLARADHALRGVWVLVSHLNNRPKRISGLVNGKENINPGSSQKAPKNPVWGKPAEVNFFKADDAKANDNKGRYMSVAQYFKDTYKKDYMRSTSPVVNVGTQSRPIFLPAEVCAIKSQQDFDRKLSPAATAEMIKFAVRPSTENAADIVSNGFGLLGMNAKTTMQSFKFGANPGLITVSARVLPGVPLQYLDANGKPKTLVSSDGQWNMRDIKFSRGCTVTNWSYMQIVVTGGRTGFPRTGEYCDIPKAVETFVRVMQNSGLRVAAPRNAGILQLANEESAVQEVQRFFKNKVATTMVLVLLPTKSSVIYNAVKKAGDIDLGVHTVCAQTQGFTKLQRIEQYHANVALKMNLKLGGHNQALSARDLPIVSSGLTMLVGLDVTHPAPGSAKNAPSVSAIVASVDKHLGQWPADVAIQTGRKEMVENLKAMFISRLMLWRKNNGQKLPDEVIVYRDGVGESMYNLVLEQELPLIREACKDTYPATDTAKNLPRVTILICGKRHKTRFYPTAQQEAEARTGGTKSGTTVDRGVTETRVWDFFIQAHTALHGTPRPAHYVVLHDEIFRWRAQQAKATGQRAADDLIALTHSLAYLHGRATKAVSLCTPAYYADLVCDRARQWLSRVFDEPTDASSDVSGSEARLSEVTVHPGLKDSMFYI